MDQRTWVCCHCKKENGISESKCKFYKKRNGIRAILGSDSIKCKHLKCKKCIVKSSSSPPMSPLPMAPTALPHHVPKAPPTPTPVPVPVLNAKPKKPTPPVEEAPSCQPYPTQDMYVTMPEESPEVETLPYPPYPPELKGHEDNLFPVQESPRIVSPKANPQHNLQQRFWEAQFDINLRSGPGMHFPVVGHLDKGETTLELSRSGNWMNHTPTNGNVSGWSVFVYNNQNTFKPFYTPQCSFAAANLIRKEHERVVR